MGVEIVGVGFAELDSIAEWRENEGYQYEMWIDSNKTLALYYGAADSADQSSPDRVTKILDSEGNLVLEYNDASFNSNPQDVLEDCKLIFGE